MILGQDRPDAGTISVGKTVRISYVDQMRAGIDSGKTVWEVISGGEAYIRAGGPISPAGLT
jgi:ATPase subunit of ABC transporter with duplicated ATPase domains